jgi:hypothetical protein
MRRGLVAGLGFLAFAGLASAAHAQRFEFDYTGSLVKFTVPFDGTYQIVAFGAQGGNVSLQGVVGPGGLGAQISGNFSLTAGEVLQIAVGGAGSGGNAAGGGGSFVVGPGDTPLVVAGGGGGGGLRVNPFLPLTAIEGLPGGSGGASAATAMVVYAVVLVPVAGVDFSALVGPVTGGRVVLRGPTSPAVSLAAGLAGVVAPEATTT